MSKKTNPAVIGAFVLGAAALSVLGLLLFGGGRFFEKTFDCVMYFDETIDGLEAGAPVSFQGVRIGTVKEVQLVFDLARQCKVCRPVIMRIEQSRINSTSRRGLDAEEMMEMLVRDSGMRAQLAMQSILTGKLKIELGFYPETQVQRKGLQPEIWEMPTIPSPLQRLSDEVAQMPLSDIVSETHKIIKGLAEIVDSAETRRTLRNLNETMDKLQSVLGRLDDEIEPLFQKSGAAMDAAGASLRELQEMLGKLDRQMGPLLTSLQASAENASRLLDDQSPLRGEIQRLARELSETSRSVRWLADYLERHPESLLRGKP